MMRNNWPAIPLTPDTGRDTVNNDDDELEFQIGGYLSLGALLDVTDRVSLAAEGRYDVVFDEAETDHASVDLDGFSGQLKILFSF